MHFSALITPFPFPTNNSQMLRRCTHCKNSHLHFRLVLYDVIMYVVNNCLWLPNIDWCELFMNENVGVWSNPIFGAVKWMEGRWWNKISCNALATYTQKLCFHWRRSPMPLRIIGYAKVSIFFYYRFCWWAKHVVLIIGFCSLPSTFFEGRDVHTVRAEFCHYRWCLGRYHWRVGKIIRQLSHNIEWKGGRKGGRKGGWKRGTTSKRWCSSTYTFKFPTSWGCISWNGEKNNDVQQWHGVIY